MGPVDSLERQKNTIINDMYYVEKYSCSYCNDYIRNYLQCQCLVNVSEKTYAYPD